MPCDFVGSIFHFNPKYYYNLEDISEVEAKKSNLPILYYVIITGSNKLVIDKLIKY